MHTISFKALLNNKAQLHTLTGDGGGVYATRKLLGMPKRVIRLKAAALIRTLSLNQSVIDLRLNRLLLYAVQL